VPASRALAAAGPGLVACAEDEDAARALRAAGLAADAVRVTGAPRLERAAAGGAAPPPALRVAGRAPGPLPARRARPPGGASPRARAAEPGLVLLFEPREPRAPARLAAALARAGVACRRKGERAAAAGAILLDAPGEALVFARIASAALAGGSFSGGAPPAS